MSVTLAPCTSHSTLLTPRGAFLGKRKFCLLNQISKIHHLLQFEYERSVLVKNPLRRDFPPSVSALLKVDFLLHFPPPCFFHSCLAHRVLCCLLLFNGCPQVRGKVLHAVAACANDQLTAYVALFRAKSIKGKFCVRNGGRTKGCRETYPKRLCLHDYSLWAN